MDSRHLQRLNRQLYSRAPLLGRWLRRRAAQALAADGTPEAVRALAEALSGNDDERVRDIAGQALEQLAGQEHVDAVCDVWAHRRHSALAALLSRHRWIASAPPQLRVLTALYVDQPDVVSSGGAQVVRPLLEASADPDSSIAQRAAWCLPRLTRQAAREALCRVVIEEEHAPAREAAIQGAYCPRDERQRALLYVLTEQWGPYERLDFDQRLLRAAYQAADPTLRGRIRERLRAAGRADLLGVVVGWDLARASVLTPEEAEFVVEMYTGSREWGKLWRLVFELPLSWGVRLVRSLGSNGWEPEAGDERSTFRELAALASSEIAATTQSLDGALPPAIQRAHARVKGRVNDVAFAPDRPVIAIATGARSVVLWNLQTARCERVLGGFAHSIGRVTFVDGGALAMAERSNTTVAPCGIYLWQPGDPQPSRLGQHVGSVTAIEPVPGHQLLSAGRDQKLLLWDVGQRVVSRVAHLPDDWMRSVCVSADGRWAVLLSRRARLVRLPEMEETASWRLKGVLRCASFASNADMILGEYNGRVWAGAGRGDEPPLKLTSWYAHAGQVQGIGVLPEGNVVITAGAEGLVRFSAWPGRGSMGSVHAQGERLTSLRIAPDGDFMAVGDSDASMSLWDLRVLMLPVLFACPMARTVPLHLAAVSMGLSELDLTPATRNALLFLHCLLRYRFRYDVEVDDLPVIRAGSYDIEIES